MTTLANGSSITLTLTDYDSVTVQTRGVATLTAVSGLDIPAGKLGEFTGSRTFGPFAAGQLTIAASVTACQYEVADGVRPSVATGGGAVATITGSYVVGQTLTAAFPAGVTGTIQFTRTLGVTPFTKSAISGAVASAVNSLAYVVQAADVGTNIGVDCTTVQAGSGGLVGSAPVTPSAAQLVIFAGQSQSNSNGNTSAQTVPAAIAGPMTDVYIWDPFVKTWVTYQAQVNSAIHLKGGLYPETSNQYFGAEAEYARRWKLDNPGVPLYMVKKGHSTTSLQQAARTTARGCWDSNLRGDLYDEFVSWVTDAKANLAATGKTVNIRGMNWTQGENDANVDAATSTAYASALTTFINSLRSANVLASTTPFIISRIQTGSWAFPAQLRASQMSVADSLPYCRWFSADTVTIDGSDTVHYGPNGVVIHGDLMYEEGLSGAETVRSYVAKTTVAPSTSQQTQMAAFIDTLIANNVWSGIAVMQMYSAATEQAALLNVRSGAVTAVNSGMTFTPGIGYTGTSTSSFINTGVNPVTGDSKLEPGNVSYALYIRGNLSTNGCDMGFVPTTTGKGILQYFTQSPGNASFRINTMDVGASNTFAGPADISGLWSVSRKSLNSTTCFQKGAQVGITDTVNADVGESSNVIFVGNRNSGNNTSGTSGTLRQYGMFIAGSGRTPAQEVALNNAVTSYLSAIGAN
jgi:hypothetical protein